MLLRLATTKPALAVALVHESESFLFQLFMMFHTIGLLICDVELLCGNDRRKPFDNVVEVALVGVITGDLNAVPGFR